MTVQEHEKQMVRSADGTRIAFAKVGSGPVPLVIVHGALNSGESWLSVATELAERCTCFVMDRWGRGGSDHRADYSFGREAEDILAVLEEAGPDACLMGHSSGAIYALEAALKAAPAGLVLYEPPLHMGARFAEDVLPRVQRAAREGRFDDAITIFFADEVEVPDAELTALKATSLWDRMVALAPQTVREWEALVAARPTVERYRSLSAPTLLLTGSLTRDHPSFATHELERALPDARTDVLEGQAHTAHRMAPDRLAAEVERFLAAAGRPRDASSDARR